MSFFDLYKDGRLDLIVHQLSNNTAYMTWDNQPVRQKQILVYLNNGYYDAFFMKVKMMVGTNNTDILANEISIGGNINIFVASLGG
jgi:hypothetical protein